MEVDGSMDSSIPTDLVKQKKIFELVISIEYVEFCKFLSFFPVMAATPTSLYYQVLKFLLTLTRVSPIF